MDPEAECRLIERSQAGDRRAFDVLFRESRERAYRLACRLTGSQSDAEDVLQEAWLRAFRGISTFDGRACFATWFYRVLIHAAADHARRLGRQPATMSLEEAEQSLADPTADSPADRVAAAELGQALHDALQTLPVDQAAALALVAFEGMSYAEAAQIQQCAEGTLAWRVAEARRRLVGLLGPYL